MIKIIKALTEPHKSPRFLIIRDATYPPENAPAADTPIPIYGMMLYGILPAIRSRSATMQRSENITAQAVMTEKISAFK